MILHLQFRDIHRMNINWFQSLSFFYSFLLILLINSILLIFYFYLQSVSNEDVEEELPLYNHYHLITVSILNIFAVLQLERESLLSDESF